MKRDKHDGRTSHPVVSATRRDIYHEIFTWSNYDFHGKL